MTIQSNDKTFLLCCDNNYAPHAGTCIFSLLLNTPDRNFDINIIGINLSQSNVLRLISLGNIFGVKIVLHEGALLINKIREEINFDSHCFQSHINDSALIRLFYEATLKTTYNRIVYLDCDIIARKDPCAIFTLDLGDKIIGATPDLIENRDFEKKSPSNEKNLSAYFNSGVLIINDKIWRDSSISQQMVSILLDVRQSNLKQADQDALNILFKNGNYHQIGYDYNYQYMASAYSILEPPDHNLDQAIFIHFAGQVKPWHIWAPKAYRKIYEQYRILSPWRENYKPEQPKTEKQFKVAVLCLTNQGRSQEAHVINEGLQKLTNAKKDDY